MITQSHEAVFATPGRAQPADLLTEATPVAPATKPNAPPERLLRHRYAEPRPASLAAGSESVTLVARGLAGWAGTGQSPTPQPPCHGSAQLPAPADRNTWAQLSALCTDDSPWSGADKTELLLVLLLPVPISHRGAQHISSARSNNTLLMEESHSHGGTEADALPVVPT